MNLSIDFRVSATTGIFLYLDFYSETKSVRVTLHDLAGRGRMRLIFPNQLTTLSRSELAKMFDEVVGDYDVRFSVKNLHRALGWLLEE